MVARRLNSRYDCRKSKLGGMVERHLEQTRTKCGLQVSFGEMLAVGQIQNLDEIHPDHFPFQGRDELLHTGVTCGVHEGQLPPPGAGRAPSATQGGRFGLQGILGPLC